MDQYTQETGVWLDERFKRCDEQGIYFAHQPIYGFRQGHCERGFVERHIRTYQIMKELAHFTFKSLLDVGGAEGFKAYIAQQIFGIHVENSDLSEEACKRAEEIFKIKSTPADLHQLPFMDNEFDVVLCSETLEHVSNLNQALSEILRIARVGAIITVPYEPESKTQENIERGSPHAHIHSFHPGSLAYLEEGNGYLVRSNKMISSLTRIPAVLVEAMPQNYEDLKRFPRPAVSLYNSLVPIFRILWGKRAAATLISLDQIICRILNLSTALMFTIVKDKTSWKVADRKIPPLEVISFAVPYHFMKRQKSES